MALVFLNNLPVWLERLRRPGIRFCGLGFGLALLVAASAAQAGSKPRGDAVDLLSVAPADARLVVAVEDLGGAWESPAIGTTIATVQSLTDLTETLEAWLLLSKQIGLAPDDAAQRLLGRRFLLVSDGEAAGSSWAIAMVVDGETAGLLRKNLKAIPRSLRDGLPVLAIEGNAFELIVQDLSRRDIAGALSNGSGGGDALVVLGPSSRAKLFDAMVRAALGGAGKEETMAGQRAGRLSRALPDGTGVALVRRDADQEHAWFVLGAMIDGHTIRLNYLRQNPQLAADRATVVKPWRLGVFDDAMGDAVFGVAEVDSLTSPLLPTLSDGFGPGMVERLKLPEEGMFAGRTMLMGYGTMAGPLDLVGVFETPDVARASVAADASIAESLSAVFGGERFEDFGGLFGAALRKVDLRGVLSRQNPTLLEGLWPEEGPVLAWTVRPSVERGAGDGLGWLVVGLGDDRVGEVAAGLTGDGSDHGSQGVLPWVSVFEVHPRRLIDQLRGQTVALPPFVGSLGAVERIRAQTLVARPDLLRGGGVIEFVRGEGGRK